MEVWKMIFLFKGVISGYMLVFGGVLYLISSLEKVAAPQLHFLASIPRFWYLCGWPMTVTPQKNGRKTDITDLSLEVREQRLDEFFFKVYSTIMKPPWKIRKKPHQKARKNTKLLQKSLPRYQRCFS